MGNSLVNYIQNLVKKVFSKKSDTTTAGGVYMTGKASDPIDHKDDDKGLEINTSSGKNQPASPLDPISEIYSLNSIRLDGNPSSLRYVRSSLSDKFPKLGTINSPKHTESLKLTGISSLGGSDQPLEKQLTLDDFLSTTIRQSDKYKDFIGKNSIDKEEEFILEDAGVPSGVIAAMKDVNQAVGGMITIRTGTPPLDGTGLQAKPLLVHAKCGNKPLGILSGLICTDPLLSKIYEDGSQKIEQAKEAISKDLSSEAINNLPLKLTLREILRKTTLPPNSEEAMVIDRIDIEEGKSFLVLKYNKEQNFGPQNFDGEFRIQLDPLSAVIDGIKPPQYQENDRLKQLDESIQHNLSMFVAEQDPNPDPKIENIKDALRKFAGDNALNLDNEFPIEYKTTSALEEEYKALEVLGMHGQKITGDIDLDYYSIPTGLPTYAYEAINALNGIKEQSSLLNNTEKLLESSQKTDSPLYPLYNKLNEAYTKMQLQNNPAVATAKLIGLNDFFGGDPEMINYFASLTGIISPVEFLQNISINILYNIENIGIVTKDNLKRLFNPIQHGAENHSPYKGNSAISSGDDGKRLHIINLQDKDPPRSQVFYTFTDEQRAKLCLTTGFLEKNYVHVNPSSNMKLWGPVVEKQLELMRTLPEGTGPRVDPATIEAYHSSVVNNTRLRKK